MKTHVVDNAEWLVIDQVGQPREQVQIEGSEVRITGQLVEIYHNGGLFKEFKVDGKPVTRIYVCCKDDWNYEVKA